MVSKAFSQQTVGQTAVQLVPANPNRVMLLLFVEGGTLYLGKDATLSVANGFPWRESRNTDDVLSDSLPATDAWWGISSSGVLDVRILEYSE